MSFLLHVNAVLAQKAHRGADAAGSFNICPPYALWLLTASERQNAIAGVGRRGMPVVQHIVCTIVGPSPDHPTLQCQITRTFYAHHCHSLRTACADQDHFARTSATRSVKAGAEILSEGMLQSNMVP